MFLKEEETTAKNGDSSEDESPNEKGMYDKAGKLKKMKHEQLKENEADQVNIWIRLISTVHSKNLSATRFKSSLSIMIYSSFVEKVVITGSVFIAGSRR